MKFLSLETQYFPAHERLEYGLKMIGAKGSVIVTTKKTNESLDIKCQVLGSLLFPPKKLVDSELTSRLEINSKTQKLEFLRHVDNDFKSESRRQMEIKNHGIETRYTKFDEERGFIDLPEGIGVADLADPLSAAFLIRDKNFLKSEKSFTMNVLVRTGVLNVRITPSEKRRQVVAGFDAERTQIRVGVELISKSQIKGPYLSPELEVWLDQETGIVVELGYPFLGSLGRATLLLQKYKT